MNPVRKLYRLLHRGARDVLATLGLNVARTSDYYSPLPVLRDLEKHRARWDRPSEMVGVAIDTAELRQRLGRWVDSYANELAALPSYDETKRLGYGPGFTEVDALVLYLALRRLKPRRYFEVGSGLSTYWASLALEANRRENHPCDVVIVDPYPEAKLSTLPHVRVRAEMAQDVELEHFAGLGENDVLFIDTTHVLKIDGEVAYLYLEVLPRLAPGVVVHSHDVHFPYNVPHPVEQNVLDAKWPRYWTEAMLLQAFLAFNSEFEIVMSIPLLRHHDEDELARLLPRYRRLLSADYDSHAGSLWYRRKPSAT